MKNEKVDELRASNRMLMRYGASAFFGMPICYIVMFLVFGVALSIPPTATVGEKIAFIESQQSLISFAYIAGYLLFGCLLLVAVQATHRRLNMVPSHLLNTASIFGYIWVVLMFGAGMTALVGMNTMLSLNAKGSPYSDTLFYVYTTVTNGLGGGIELVGGMWVLLISLYGLQQAQSEKRLHTVGLVVGTLGILTLFQSVAEIKAAFGLSQIAWFIWMGYVLLKDTTHNYEKPH
ncbi:hypothetical protein DRW07_13405 [Alteromonas sediminis]|uniref:DUF4386 family protein n=2 Tax=Alteromonas sediminis TaxID=2259342 RepID=A0A3N5YAJ1_9ALTE|nr:hypothetical protein [Alteromonas sediminis]RPJ65805.1 hypothetical protein DRW07_13405 [Alteromonas sediminis]